ncbi:MAG: hypothetical protein MJ131_07240 [Lachnospiraceae bacterium]|nr:hypothetical protein [Lachnospiraceae bacterium]
MKSVKKFLPLLLILLLLISAVPVSAADAKLNKTKAKMNLGTVLQLHITVSGKNVDKEAEWKSADSSVAKVNSNGAVFPVSAGSTKIVVRYSGKKYSCKITVLPPHLSKTSYSVDPKKTVKVKLVGASAAGFEIANEFVATVSAKGVVTGIRPGITDIIVKDTDGSSYTSTLRVNGDICNHNLVTDPAVPATCTNPGLTAGSHCIYCDDIFIARGPIPPTGHSYDSEGYCKSCGAADPIRHHNCGTKFNTYRQEATCTTDGLSDHVTCAICGKVFMQGKVIKALGHDFSSTGYCKRCGIEYVHVHTWVSVAQKNPTCTTTGTTAYTYCKECGEYNGKYPEMIPQLGHDYVGSKDKCTRCGADEHGHLHTWRTTKYIQATCENFGYTESKICATCGYEEIPLRSMPPLGHHDGNRDGKCDLCKKEMK